MADAERDAGTAAGRKRRRRVGDCESERLFAEHMLAVRRRGLDLRAVAAVRRREHDGVDGGSASTSS